MNYPWPASAEAMLDLRPHTPDQPLISRTVAKRAAGPAGLAAAAEHEAGKPGWGGPLGALHAALQHVRAHAAFQPGTAKGGVGFTLCLGFVFVFMRLFNQGQHGV